MIHLSTVTLVREQQMCVLQGIVHIAPPGLYQYLQQDMQKYRDYGFQIFAEGWDPKRCPELYPDLTKRQEYIATYLTIITSRDELADAFALSLQKCDIHYPADTVFVDMRSLEVVLMLDRLGFRVPQAFQELFDLLKSLNDPRSLTKCQKNAYTEKLKNVLAKFKEAPEASNEAIFNSVILDYRNELVFDKLREYFWSSLHARGLVHYGNDHIPGLLTLLENDHWKVHSHTKITVGSKLFDKL